MSESTAPRTREQVEAELRTARRAWVQTDDGTPENTAALLAVSRLNRELAAL